MHSNKRPLRVWLTLAWLASACTNASGTPTPEPPDHLPSPEIVLPVFTSETREDARVPLPPATLSGMLSAPGIDAWVVDLDSPEVAPVRATASASRAFTVEVRGARSGDRIRVIARSATQHSLASDLEIHGPPQGPAAFRALAPTALPCLEVTPRDELTELVSAESSGRRGFVLENRCAGPVAIDRAALRLGDPGFTLDPAPASIPAGGQVTLTMEIAGHEDAAERADVLLLDVSQGGQAGRYALGVYSVSSSSRGKP